MITTAVDAATDTDAATEIIEMLRIQTAHAELAHNAAAKRYNVARRKGDPTAEHLHNEFRQAHARWETLDRMHASAIRIRCDRSHRH
jgi:hypothetical protein